jgi:hypothetical protein
MTRSSVTVVPMGEGRFMVVPAEPSVVTEQEPDSGEENPGHTEVDLREILAHRHGLSPEEIEEHIAAARS